MMSKNVKLVIVKLTLVMKEHFEKLLLNSLYFITYLLLLTCLAVNINSKRRLGDWSFYYFEKEPKFPVLPLLP